MAFKFFYLYFIGGILAFLLAAYRLYTEYPALHNIAVAYFLPALLLFYLAYKTYHEKKDKEMM
jgi:predicted membrane channel-forming protein YqfA (hemolysin III family)